MTRAADDHCARRTRIDRMRQAPDTLGAFSYRAPSLRSEQRRRECDVARDEGPWPSGLATLSAAQQPVEDEVVLSAALTSMETDTSGERRVPPGAAPPLSPGEAHGSRDCAEAVDRQMFGPPPT